MTKKVNVIARNVLRDEAIVFFLQVIGLPRRQQASCRLLAKTCFVLDQFAWPTKCEQPF